MLFCSGKSKTQSNDRDFFCNEKWLDCVCATDTCYSKDLIDKPFQWSHATKLGVDQIERKTKIGTAAVAETRGKEE